jgi:tetratricopeptide (TPR) repeat protein
MNQVCLSKTSNLHKQDKYAGHIKALIMNLFQMKRLLIVFLLFSGLTTAMAQTDVILLNYNTLEKKFDKSNEDIQNPKKNIKAKTWFSRGETLQDIFEIDIEFLSEGIDKTRIQLYYKEPKEVVTETLENGQKKEILKYDRIDYVLENGGMVYYVRKQSVTEDPLDKAFEAYKKAYELDKEGYADKVKEKLIVLKNQYRREGINAYFANNSDKALADFEMVNKVNSLEMFEGVVDTVMIQYSGIMAREKEDYKKAIHYYEKLADLDFGGPATFFSIKNDYLAMDDTTNAILTMEKAFEKYPDTLNVVANLVDIYIKTKKIDEGITTIDKTIAKYPEKGELYYWKGRLLLNSEFEDKIEQALGVYQTALEKDESLYYVYYDIGLIKFLQGQDIFSQAGLEKDIKRREQISAIATEKYEESIPMILKSLEYNDGNESVKSESLDILKRIYYKLYGPEDQRYLDVVDEIDNL